MASQSSNPNQEWTEYLEKIHHTLDSLGEENRNLREALVAVQREAAKNTPLESKFREVLTQLEQEKQKSAKFEVHLIILSLLVCTLSPRIPLP